ncbi:MAG: N-acetylmuramoyl-L-alanine amidase [Clostridia bacterium]
MKNYIKKKRLLFVSVFVCFSLCIYAILNIKGENIKANQAIKVNAMPITNKIIVIDAGHGIPDEGAIGFNGTTEQAINLDIALKIQKLIEQSGGKILLTRSDENGIYSSDRKSIRNKKVSDIKNRVEIGNNFNADLFISIHLNKYPPSEKYRGWQTFYQKQNENSKKLANLVQENINKNIEFENSRTPLPISGVYIMDKVNVPSIVIECGFLSNPEETRLLKTDEYQNKLAWGIYIGIQNYFLGGVIPNE